MASIYKRGKIWWIDFQDENGIRRKQTLRVRDKRTAETLQRQIESDLALVKRGLKVPTSDKAFTEVLEMYLAQIHKSERYVRYCRQQIERIGKALNWKTVNDIDGLELQTHVLGLQLKNRTKESYLEAVKTFCRWCVRHGILNSDPTRNIKPPPPDESNRRPLTHEEWKKLEKYLGESYSVKNGMEAFERLVFYRTAIETGYRVGELLALRSTSVRDKSLFLDGKFTKNGKDANQFVSDELLRMLILEFKGFTPTDRTKVAHYLRSDCEDAGINPENIDFHCLRVTCGTWLAKAGVGMFELQKIMRHAKIETTIKHYLKFSPDYHSQNRNVIGDLMK